MTGEEGLRAYWDSGRDPNHPDWSDRSGQHTTIVEQMSKLWNHASWRLDEYPSTCVGSQNTGSQTNDLNVVGSEETFEPEAPILLIGPYTSYDPVDSLLPPFGSVCTGAMVCASGVEGNSDDTDRIVLEKLFSIALELNPSIVFLERDDSDIAIPTDKEILMKIIEDALSVEPIIISADKTPPKIDDFKEVMRKYGTEPVENTEPETSPGMNPPIRYMKAKNGQYFIGVKGAIYQIGSGVLNNYKIWAYEENKAWGNISLFPDSWNNYIFASDEKFNPKTDVTETEMVNIVTARRGKIYHEFTKIPEVHRKFDPFFVKGHMYGLYSYFEDELGFPTGIENFAPDAGKVKTSKGEVEYRYNPYINNVILKVSIPDIFEFDYTNYKVEKLLESANKKAAVFSYVLLGASAGAYGIGTTIAAVIGSEVVGEVGEKVCEPIGDYIGGEKGRSIGQFSCRFVGQFVGGYIGVNGYKYAKLEAVRQSYSPAQQSAHLKLNELFPEKAGYKIKDPGIKSFRSLLKKINEPNRGVTIKYMANDINSKIPDTARFQIITDVKRINNVEALLKTKFKNVKLVDSNLHNPKASGFRVNQFVFEEGGKTIELQALTEMGKVWKTWTDDIYHDANFRHMLTEYPYFRAVSDWLYNYEWNGDIFKPLPIPPADLPSKWRLNN